MAGSKFQVYATPVSVYCCKLRLALALKRLHWRETEPPGGYGSADYRAVVAQGTVPALVHDGFVLADSEAIIEYLDDIGAGRPLLPARARARARARALSRFIDTRLEPALRALFPCVGTGDAAPEAARTTLAAHLHTLTTLAGPGPFLSGSAPGLPDCGLWAVAAVHDVLNRALALDLPAPALSAAGDTVPECAPHLRAYRAALADWAATRGARA
ncbi:MAG: glutathione S-transferase [Rhodobacteraceae bacterium]|nr:glutathione S-transferase [Paracoccaceae bacterium]